MSKQKVRSYNLKKLIDFIGDDEAAIRNMVSIFLSSTPELLEKIKVGFVGGDLVAVGKAAHMLKPTLDIFGINEMYDPIRRLEVLAKSNDGGNETKKIIQDLNETLQVVFQHIKEDYPKL
jgi:HPt (histidine-containing phosphotransfer) domain-containing protein